MHVVLGQYIHWIALFVKVGAISIETVGAFEEEATVLGAAIGRVHQAAVEHMLVNCKNRDRCLAST